LVTINPSIYYLKFNHQNSEILLTENSDWPKDTDNREQAIEVSFTTKAYNGIDSIKTIATEGTALQAAQVAVIAITGYNYGQYYINSNI